MQSITPYGGKGAIMPTPNPNEEGTNNEPSNQGNPPADTGVSNEQNPPAGGSGTLTKEQADALIKARIDKQNVKHAKETESLMAQLAEEQASREELAAKVAAYEHEKELSEWRKQASDATGVPAEILKGDTLEEIQAHAEQIKATIPMYPTLQHDTGEGNVPALTKDDINSIKNREERVRAFALHDELF